MQRIADDSAIEVPYNIPTGRSQDKINQIYCKNNRDLSSLTEINSVLTKNNSIFTRIFAVCRRNGK
jgi:hypothetical protein